MLGKSRGLIKNWLSALARCTTARSAPCAPAIGPTFSASVDWKMAM